MFTMNCTRRAKTYADQLQFRKYVLAPTKIGVRWGQECILRTCGIFDALGTDTLAFILRVQAI